MRKQLTLNLVIFVCSMGVVFAGGPEISKEIRPTPVANPFSWEGPYIGLHAGGNVGTGESSDLNFFDSTFPRGDTWDYDTSGFIGGLQAGYNWQRHCFVLGIEADLGYMNIDGSGSHPLDSSTVTSVESDFYSTLRGRLGFAHDHWLFYVTGGGILVHTDLSVDTSRGSSSHSAYLPGLAGGAGIEYAFNDRWSLKGEYLYYELENDPIGLRAASGNIPGEGFSRTFFEMRNSGYIVRLGVNYHFGGPAPMSAPVISERGMMDKSSKNPVRQYVTAEPFNWTGPYAGVHFGYASGGLAWLDEPPDSNDNMAHYYQQGVFGGVQMGLNYQIHCLVLGLEGKFSGTGIDHQFTKDQNDEPNSFDTNIDWMGSLSLRAGFALPNILNGRLLAYAKGGISDVHQNYHWDHLDNSEEGGAIHHDVYNSDESRFGPMVGGGFEYAINDHWTAHLEYNYADYGSKIIHGLRSDFPLTETEAYESKLRLHMVEVGVNYKF